jgi:hypothetical protein
VPEATRLVDISLEAGLNMFDSADVYSDGMEEEILGKAIAGRRDKVLISPKATAGLPISMTARRGNGRGSCGNAFPRATRVGSCGNPGAIHLLLVCSHWAIHSNQRRVARLRAEWRDSSKPVGQP